MNYIDYIIIFFVIIGFIEGIFKGFIIEIASFLALILGVWGAIKFAGVMANFMSSHWDIQGEYVQIIAFLITFVLIVITVHFIGKVIQLVIKAVSLGFIDRIFGAIFGLFKTLFVLCVLLIILDKLEAKVPILPEKVVTESRFYKPLSDISIRIFPFLEGLYNGIQEKIKPDDEPDADTHII